MIDILLPESAKLFSMTKPIIITDPAWAVEQALRKSIGSPNLEEIVIRKLRSNRDCKVAIVISDNTRPVLYKGNAGILWPIIKKITGYWDFQR